MGTLHSEVGDVEYQWASDINFEGVRLEILNANGDMFFDVSVPDQGPITVNTFSQEVAAALIIAAVDVARQRASSANAP